jgi:hypothetical protein
MGMRRDVRRKAEQIARMLWLGCDHSRTAQLMGMSCSGLLRITKTQEFQKIEDGVRQAVLGKMDDTLERLRQEM